MTEEFTDPPGMTPDLVAHRAPGLVLHSPRLYDLMVRVFLLGRERSFRERLLALAALRSAESVLDIGCGTGSLAILARSRVGISGSVVGMDASAEMIARARRKADRAGVKVEFYEAFAQALPLPSAQFDVVLSTLMLHHLPKPAHARFASEARRVLKPGGRLLVVDFAKSSARGPPWWVLHQRHGSIDPREMVMTLVAAGFDVTAKGPFGLKDLTFVLALASGRAQSPS
ncbi:MAG TPA: class I SAM-dependent methyltransferase [Steroidobacteraceae bacterium]|nr:class I SAM-dependent methyltransferase [Steroidobacteraceae bacterium]